MTNPIVLKSVLCDGTIPDIQDCTAEEASIYPLYTVHPSEDHGPNGVKLANDEDPNVNTAEFDIGVVEIEEIRPETQLKYNQSVAYDDNNHLLVHWLKPGDKFYAKITDPTSTLARGTQMVLGAGVWKKPDAVAAFSNTGHLCSVQRQVVTGDTIAKLKYLGMGPFDAA